MTKARQSSLPASVEAERGVLGSVLLENAHLQEAAGAGLVADDFSLDSHRRLYRAIQEIAQRQGVIDLITLTAEMARRNDLERVGGAGYISSLTDGLPRRSSVAHYIAIVREQALIRRYAKAGEQIQRLANQGAPADALSAVVDSLAHESDSDLYPPRFSEEALALRFSRQHADVLRYVAGWGRWLCWVGTRWCEDSTLSVFDQARAICRAASAECSEQEKTATRLAAAATVAAVERLARADRRHAATVEQWDSDPWLLNTPAGTVDLRTGAIHAHDRRQYLTKLAAAGPDGDCPLWLRFLDRVTDGDTELQAFLQRVVGYCLTGITREHALFFMYGTGANGKSVFLSTIAGLVADYAKTAPASAFTASSGEQHPTDLAGLRGARFVTAIETEDGRWWAEAKIKALTGGDRITARFMRQDFFEYVPQFKLVVAGNHKPGLRNVDEAIRRRLHLIPFTVTIPESERDKDLPEKLKAEWPGILAWAIEGCLAWQHEGLNPPAVVREATEEYLATEDALGRWMEERCALGPRLAGAAGALFGDWTAWCEATGEKPSSQKMFAEKLKARPGIEKVRSGHSRTRGFAGIALRGDL